MRKLGLKFLYVFFLIENSCMNCLKVDRIQDNEKKRIYFFFLNKRIPKPSLKSEKETTSPAQTTGLGWRRPPPEIAARWRCVPLIKKMTAHYNSQFLSAFVIAFRWEAQNAYKWV